MKDRALNTSDIAPFVLVTEAEKLIPVLESRLPKSSQLYNAVQMYPKFKDEITIYTYNPDEDHSNTGSESKLSPNVWIISIYTRKDIAQDVVISAPGNIQITEKIKEAFSNSKILNWTESFVFSVRHREISLLICEISLLKGTNAKMFPCHFYYCPRDDALALDTSHADDVELKPVDLVTGPDFIYNTWAYSIEGSLDYITQCIERNISSAVYNKEDGKPISGILTNPAGLMGMLYTDKAYRNKNYGKLCMQKLMKDLIKNGFVACSAVEMCNEPSKNFHTKIGMKPHGIIDFIRFDGPTKFK